MDTARRLSTLITKSGDLVVTRITTAVKDIRKYYLDNVSETEPAIVCASDAVPKPMVAHLLARKKDSAIQVKYEFGDDISNMEGAIHTVVAPVAPKVLMFGDYRFMGHHQVPFFPAQDGYLQAREVIVSAIVQPDFETYDVLFELTRLSGQKILGVPLAENWVPASSDEKRDKVFLEAYEMQLKQHMIHWFTKSKSLPAFGEPASKQHVIERIRSGDCENLYFQSHGSVLSIEMLYNIICEQQRIEHRALDEVSPNGYVYTWDPPAIFAQTLDSDILDELWAASISRVDSQNLKIVGFNAWNNDQIIPLLKSSMQVPVVAKADLFTGEDSKYKPPREYYDCALVLHNNSDAFGQNVETESEYTSLDGALGSKSSLAAHVHRQRQFLAIDF